MRTFIAIEIPENIKNNIYNYLENKGFYHIKSLKFVEKENFHITLSFLGEQDLDLLLPKLEFLTEKRVEYISTTNDYSANNMGIFPNKGNPRVFWIGIKDNQHDIFNFVTSIENTLLKKHIIKKVTDHFIPHITIARNKRNCKIDFDSNINFNFGHFSIKKITLFSSKLTPKGPIYSVIKKY